MDALLVTSNRTKMKGIHPRKHTIRFVFRSLSFLALIAIYAFIGYLNNDDHAIDHDRILEDVAVQCTAKADPAWLVAPLILLIIYMFLALAVVCDELFVPALEEMSGPHQLNLSMDIAGATLMAAGGSAPELFTSFIGTFQESAVGFGTIVGSAVFNVLFVIGMCSLLSNETLQLTWWPLFRDSIYYVIGLGVLAIFVGVVSPEEIEIWEAAILFIMYFGYCILMAYNQRLYDFINKTMLKKKKDEGKNEGENEAEDDVIEQTEEGGDSDMRVRESVFPSDSQGNIEVQGSSRIDFRWPGTFRTGVVKLMTKPASWKDTAGANLVASIKGNVDEVFSHVDEDNSNSIDKEELLKVLEELDIIMVDEDFEKLYSELDENGDGQINKSEFEKWYFHSQERMMKGVEKVFKELDQDNNGTLSREEIKELLNTVSNPTEEEVSAAIQQLYQSGDKNEITYEEFADWYKDSLVYEHEREDVEEAEDGIFASVRIPKKGSSCWAYFVWLFLLPITLTLAFTVPDVRRPGVKSWLCYISFVLSIIWIGLYSWAMVWATTMVGATFGIPDVIMGLTFLAAGTSVPDLLSSVIVARQGRGDMAVSSSIGSNIFDILVGLPLPWLIYTIWPTTKSVVSIGADGLAVSIIILVVMIILIILTIHFSGWKLTKCAGWMMFVFYAGFLVQAIIRELPFKQCGN